MNVLLISQCDKRALTETRRILDQFAERRGDRTWQTPITQDGLDTLRRLLRQTARKNTAVACHWIRGLDHSELLWTVGDASRFNDQGAVPTNTTRRNVLRAHDQNDWHHGDLLRLLADMAGLMHDLGKAIQAFQERLIHGASGRNLIRHEWVSLRLLEAFVGRDGDAAWLARLAQPSQADVATWTERLHRDVPGQPNPSPFKGLAQAPLAQALGWLVLTHHRLPVLPFGAPFQASLLEGGLALVSASWNESEFSQATPEGLQPYWTFPHGLPVATPEWQQRAARIAQRLSAYADTEAAKGLLDNPFVMHLARLSLMLADHHYSSLGVGSDLRPVRDRVMVAAPTALWANTRPGGLLNQTLDEHLVGVAQHSAEVARFLPEFERHLPRLGKHRKLKQRSVSEAFRWQDKAADLAAGLREASQTHGAFIINMASTGCGKTLGNARIMYALADPVMGMRCAFAMGLRTLTLQTGQAFRHLLGLGDDELAIRVGGAPSRTLFEHFEQQAEASGSASRQSLFADDGDDGHVLYEGQHHDHPLLRRAVVDPEVRKLLLAPLLVCTVDHLTPATESQRGGRQIAPMLRLMSGDLVLDEPDDFDLADLPALTRLVHWAGLLGARVLLSSATLPPALVQGLFEAYAAGRQQFQANRGARPAAGAANPPVVCMWVDEFARQHAPCADASDFGTHHQTFAQERALALARQAELSRRRVELRPLEGLSGRLEEACQSLAAAALQSACELHAQHHSVDPHTGKRVSFGLVRLANVEPLIQVAISLLTQEAPPGLRIHLRAYHSRHPLLIRSAIERQLDSVLKRHQPSAVFDTPAVRERLQSSTEEDHLFVVLGSPVTEVGRDHDYDWAVVEPSSLRSLIQLLGRVRRHRAGPCLGTNVHVFSRNLRSFTHPTQAAFCRPGFESDSGAFRLGQHDLRALLDPQVLATLDARPRILCAAQQVLSPQSSLIDLEHARMQDQMLPRTVSAVPKSGRKGGTPTSPPINASSWWRLPPSAVLLTGLLPQQQPFRDDGMPPDVALVLLPDESGDEAVLHQVLEPKRGRRGDTLYVRVERELHHPLSDAVLRSKTIVPWGVLDYMAELRDLSEAMDRPLRWCAERFGTVNVSAHEAGWCSHPALGFWKVR
ncbi:type I-F CRISPR-associated helicase Cas3f [Curvibacter sp. HBC61]|uniref:Type I-F CRISPR-associated helicase Cas3f n=1 Tax=Curvibacter cyanobacteriorum TaxID=3026422 RepID=A0ABT5N1K9_9BURK|nr:type I-F CRISPR-associated helicase Cas3f [Curvibacter sp. HBC61]MDD0840196.1 type I-F CRISPR-associated helicase Cas3f [Curvibacter sp. HBC61]